MVAEPAASPQAEIETGARALILAYARAINARDINQLRGLYPAMPAERERQWRDLFRDEVKDLSAAVSAIRIAPGSPPQADFALTLGFRPDRGKPQTFRVSSHAVLRQGASGWQFDRLEEKGQ